jgi:two-component system, response regulator YesN
MIRMMIAEDEKLERESLRLLIETNYADRIKIVYEAGMGNEAVEQAKRLRPNLILMDIHMPQMNGLEASEIIKQTLPDTEIVILTAYSYFEYAKRALHVGAADYLVKPISNKDFFTMIDRQIENIESKRKQNVEQNHLHEQIFKLTNLLEHYGIDTALPDLVNEDQIVELVKRYIDSNLAEDISLEKVSKEIGMSTFYLSKYFKKTEGINFKDYVIKARMEKAKFLLSFKSLNVQETAMRVGYPDPNYFSRAFKKYTGQSPSEFFKY